MCNVYLRFNILYRYIYKIFPVGILEWNRDYKELKGKLLKKNYNKTKQE